MKAVIVLNEAGEEKEACLPLPLFFVVCVWQVLCCLLMALLPGVAKE